MASRFTFSSSFKPAGDQPQAIRELAEGVRSEARHQVLLGVTGSGKTYTVAKVIEAVNLPTLVLSPNKVLAAQLYAEFKSFFPGNAVEYFVSYYDYYQPEAYVPQTDTYIEKDAAINEHIDKLRLKATSTLLSRRDVIVVASVSCIYNIGSPENYRNMCVFLEENRPKNRAELLDGLVKIHYERNQVEFKRGVFRVRGNVVDVFPAYSDTALRIELDGNTIRSLTEIHPVTSQKLKRLRQFCIYPAKHFITSQPRLEAALAAIKNELEERLAWLKSAGKNLEAERLRQKTRYDLEMLKELGFCHGVENYSRHLSGKKPGERPDCLLDYFPKDFLMLIDESHIAVPQIGGMYEGDRSRKQTLIDFGFRLPSALDNRPLKFQEFESLAPQVIYISATPGPYELKKSNGVIVDQVIRPTGLVDPPVIVRPAEGQIQDLIGRIETRVRGKERVLVNTLTKRTAEDLSAFLSAKGIRVQYLHSDIDALRRVQILKELRQGNFDVLVGINLLREGLDLPEVSLVAILDADNEGFLRSATTLIQIAGRAARNLNGEVIFYADRQTAAMRQAMDEMSRRRSKQALHNKKYRITPRTIQKAVHELEEFEYEAKKETLSLLKNPKLGSIDKANLPAVAAEIEKQMKEAAENLDFELAAMLRDQLFEIKEMRVKQGNSDRVAKG